MVPPLVLAGWALWGAPALLEGDFVDFYLANAGDLRLAAYIVIATYFVFRGAYKLSIGLRTDAALMFATGTYFVASFHYALTRDPKIALWFTTPVVLIMAMLCIWRLVTMVTGARDE